MLIMLMLAALACGEVREYKETHREKRRNFEGVASFFLFVCFKLYSWTACGLPVVFLGWLHFHTCLIHTFAIVAFLLQRLSPQTRHIADGLSHTLKMIAHNRYFKVWLSVALKCMCTCLPVSYRAYETVVGEMDGFDAARGLIVSEGHQGGVICHLREMCCWCIPWKSRKQNISCL